MHQERLNHKSAVNSGISFDTKNVYGVNTNTVLTPQKPVLHSTLSDFMTPVFASKSDTGNVAASSTAASISSSFVTPSCSKVVNVPRVGSTLERITKMYERDQRRLRLDSATGLMTAPVSSTFQSGISPLITELPAPLITASYTLAKAIVTQQPVISDNYSPVVSTFPTSFLDSLDVAPDIPTGLAQPKLVRASSVPSSRYDEACESVLQDHKYRHPLKRQHSLSLSASSDTKSDFRRNSLQLDSHYVDTIDLESTGPDGICSEQLLMSTATSPSHGDFESIGYDCGECRLPATEQRGSTSPGTNRTSNVITTNVPVLYVASTSTAIPASLPIMRTNASTGIVTADLITARVTALQAATVQRSSLKQLASALGSKSSGLGSSGLVKPTSTFGSAFPIGPSPTASLTARSRPVSSAALLGVRRQPFQPFMTTVPPPIASALKHAHAIVSTNTATPTVSSQEETRIAPTKTVHFATSTLALSAPLGDLPPSPAIVATSPIISLTSNGVIHVTPPQLIPNTYIILPQQFAAVTPNSPFVAFSLTAADLGSPDNTQITRGAHFGHRLSDSLRMSADVLTSISTVPVTSVATNTASGQLSPTFSLASSISPSPSPPPNYATLASAQSLFDKSPALTPHQHRHQHLAPFDPQFLSRVDKAQFPFGGGRAGSAMLKSSMGDDRQSLPNSVEVGVDCKLPNESNKDKKPHQSEPAIYLTASSDEILTIGGCIGPAILATIGIVDYTVSAPVEVHASQSLVMSAIQIPETCRIDVGAPSPDIFASDNGPPSIPMEAGLDALTVDLRQPVFAMIDSEYVENCHQTLNQCLTSANTHPEESHVEVFEVFPTQPPGVSNENDYESRYFTLSGNIAKAQLQSTSYKFGVPSDALECDKTCGTAPAVVYLEADFTERICEPSIDDELGNIASSTTSDRRHMGITVTHLPLTSGLDPVEYVNDLSMLPTRQNDCMSPTGFSSSAIEANLSRLKVQSSAVTIIQPESDQGNLEHLTVFSSAPVALAPNMLLVSTPSAPSMAPVTSTLPVPSVARLAASLATRRYASSGSPFPIAPLSTTANINPLSTNSPAPNALLRLLSEKQAHDRQQSRTEAKGSLETNTATKDSVNSNTGDEDSDVDEGEEVESDEESRRQARALSDPIQLLSKRITTATQSKAVTSGSGGRSSALSDMISMFDQMGEALGAFDRPQPKRKTIPILTLKPAAVSPPLIYAHPVPIITATLFRDSGSETESEADETHGLDSVIDLGIYTPSHRPNRHRPLRPSASSISTEAELEAEQHQQQDTAEDNIASYMAQLHTAATSYDKCCKNNPWVDVPILRVAAAASNAKSSLGKSSAVSQFFKGGMRSALMKGLASMRVSADSTDTSKGAGGDKSGVGLTQLSQFGPTHEATPKNFSGDEARARLPMIGPQLPTYDDEWGGRWRPSCWSTVEPWLPPLICCGGAYELMFGRITRLPCITNAATINKSGKYTENETASTSLMAMDITIKCYGSELDRANTNYLGVLDAPPPATNTSIVSLTSPFSTTPLVSTGESTVINRSVSHCEILVYPPLQRSNPRLRNCKPSISSLSFGVIDSTIGLYRNGALDAVVSRVTPQTIKALFNARSTPT